MYMERFADKYDLLPYIKLNSKVLSAVWKEEEGICMLSRAYMFTKKYAE